MWSASKSALTSWRNAIIAPSIVTPSGYIIDPLEGNLVGARLLEKSGDVPVTPDPATAGAAQDNHD